MAIWTTSGSTNSIAKVIPRDLLHSSPNTTITTCNLNGLKLNGHQVAKRLATPTQCLLFQETKFQNARHLETFEMHLNNEVGLNNYVFFTNDHRTLLNQINPRRSSGVAMYFHKSMPGFSHLHHLQELDVPDRYMVVKTQWQQTTVYIHNVYAPVIPRDRADFFASLPRQFDERSLHIVGGDFNIPFDETLDTTHHRLDHNQGKQECFEWLSCLHVLDPWRLHHPDKRVFSGPGQSNRLDYLLVDHELIAQNYKSTTYVSNHFGGDHLCHTVVLTHGTASHGPSYWRLPRELLLNPDVANAIKTEASELLDKMQADESLNYGALWYGWLKRIKKKLKQSHHHQTTFVQDISMDSKHIG